VLSDGARAVCSNEQKPTGNGFLSNCVGENLFNFVDAGERFGRSVVETPESPFVSTFAFVVFLLAAKVAFAFTPLITDSAANNTQTLAFSSAGSVGNEQVPISLGWARTLPNCVGEYLCNWVAVGERLGRAALDVLVSVGERIRVLVRDTSASSFVRSLLFEFLCLSGVSDLFLSCGFASSNTLALVCCFVDSVFWKAVGVAPYCFSFLELSTLVGE